MPMLIFLVKKENFVTQLMTPSTKLLSKIDERKVNLMEIAGTDPYSCNEGGVLLKLLVSILEVEYHFKTVKKRMYYLKLWSRFQIV